jgi:NAD(P)-dependent dehydrogenase (short-subunit alcohol dehydrogenase family)
LGRCIVPAFLQAGARIVTMDRRVESDGQLDDQAALRLAIDVTNEDSVRQAFQQTSQELGPIDVLVHTVGGWDGRPFLETSLDQWNAMVGLNLTSAFLCFREAARQMQGRGGTIVGIASGQGADRGMCRQSAYSASKGGLIRLIEAIAAEYQESGTRALAIAPSTLLFDENSNEAGVPAEDVAALCVYASSAAGKSLNGATLRAYGP